MAESAAINKSLSVLGQVVHALNQGAVSYSFFPSIIVRELMRFIVPDSVQKFQADPNLARRAWRFVGGCPDLQSRTRRQI